MVDRDRVASEWPMRYEVAGGDRATVTTVCFRPALASPLARAYPAGVHDLQVIVDGLGDPDALRDGCLLALGDKPDCRRITFASAVGDLAAVKYAEAAGFRYVLDVDVREPTSSTPAKPADALSLLVFEPEWVTEQPTAVSELPL